MILSHEGKTPHIDAAAWVAPTATVCGDVVIGPGARVSYGATVVAEGGRIEIGTSSVILENAVVRSTVRHSTVIGNHCVIGPTAHLVGCTLEPEVFVATGAAIFHAAYLEQGSEVRINGVVHLRSRLAAGETVPIGWVAVGDPATIFAPDRHDDIWALQEPLDFPLTAYGIPRSEADMRVIAERLSDALASHEDDEEI
jgi:carbonic anhydrase/acetyltransferase-like protein (isoleucine patch superfamily)